VPTVSIITAAFAPSADYLAETVSGVQCQTLPRGWDLEWVVQEDGASPFLADRFSGLDYVRYEPNEAHLGIATTRNLALSRAAGDLIQVLDSDDVLLPGAIASLVPHFDDTDIHWAVGQADDLMPDGSRITWNSALDYGTVPAGIVNEWAEAHGGTWPIHCAGLMLRSLSLRAVGGWVGLPGGEDIAMFTVLSQISNGYNVDRTTWLYRQHPGQTTRLEGSGQLSAACRRWALQRAKAVQLTNMRFGPHGRFGHGQASHAVPVGPAVKAQRPIDAHPSAS
jgi:glycosyltransferase involved in cell wall biosynthesis